MIGVCPKCVRTFLITNRTHPNCPQCSAPLLKREMLESASITNSTRLELEELFRTAHNIISLAHEFEYHELPTREAFDAVARIDGADKRTLLDTVARMRALLGI